MRNLLVVIAVLVSMVGFGQNTKTTRMVHSTYGEFKGDEILKSMGFEFVGEEEEVKQVNSVELAFNNIIDSINFVILKNESDSMIEMVLKAFEFVYLKKHEPKTKVERTTFAQDYMHEHLNISQFNLYSLYLYNSYESYSEKEMVIIKRVREVEYNITKYQINKDEEDIRIKSKNPNLSISELKDLTHDIESLKTERRMFKHRIERNYYLNK